QPGLVQRDALAAQPAPDDLRTRVVDSRAQRPSRPVAALDHLAVVLRRQQRLHLVGEDPRVTGQNPGPGVGLEFKRWKRSHPPTVPDLPAKLNRDLFDPIPSTVNAHEDPIPAGYSCPFASIRG